MTLIKDRMEHTARLFGVAFPIRIEPSVYLFAERLSPDYQGGYWHFYSLNDGGFYMAPDGNYSVVSDNGFSGTMSGDAFGITACLYAYSHLSFWPELTELCGRHYHLLREYMFEHPEARAILAAID